MGLLNLGLIISRSVFDGSIYVIIVCCIILLHSGFSVTMATSRLGGNETDRLALLAFKAEITNDPLRALSSWNESVDFCQWHGVTCSRRHQRVTVLDLQSLKLVGSISPHIGNLSFLNTLRLVNNSFNHVIPPELGRLKRLQYLQVHNNSIEGEIPANISGCSALISFQVEHNSLVGKIPAELGYLSKLKGIYVNNNNLTGSIPPPLGNLSFLQYFYATRNSLVGSIPDAICRLPNITAMVMGGNMLSGEIPPPLFNHSSLVAIDVTNNQIQGSLPSSFGNTLPNLEFIGIAINQFIGSIPVSISNATNLVSIITAVNKLTGKVHTLEKLCKLRQLLISHNNLGSREAGDLNFLASLTNATSLEKLELQQNNFGGKLPESIGNLSAKVVVMALANNHLSGDIPIGILNLVNLESLYMEANQFTGNIPHDIGRLQKLQILGFLKNKLSGNIPSSIGNLTFLTQFSLRENLLNGNIPPSLGKCKKLLLLDLSQNNLSGTIPQQIFGLSSLSMALDLSGNHLTGSLSMEVGNLINLGFLDVSHNELFGQVPDSLGSCVTLEILLLHGNLFNGTIPSSLRSLRGISSLDLSQNNFSGKIPEYLEGFKGLQYLNLSFNDLEGTVPREGIFKNASAISVTGNSKLCGGIPELKLPLCNSKGSGKKRSVVSSKLVIIISCGIVGLMLLLFVLYFFWFRRTKKVPSSDSQSNSLLQVSYQSLLKATDGFSIANLIGMGSFGSVYKGILDHDGSIIAVKVLNLAHRGASKSFLAECEALRNIRHRNLLKVLTACSSVDHQGNDFKALVYEFMENGSLEEWLHPNSSEDFTDEVPKKLNFLQRLNTAINVAYALDYLHHQCQIPIVHCDLKPSNVLLDNEMTAHVGDFGLARFLRTATGDTTNHTSSIGVRGSIGYTAPEYGIGSEVSTSGDVYSFGILLLEMFIGKRPTDDMFRDGLNIHNFTKAALPEKVEEIMDPILLQENANDELTSANGTNNHSSIKSHKVQGCLVSIFELGVACSAELASERMTITDVAVELHTVRDIFCRTGIHKAPQTMTTPQSTGD
ncbi:probable LRR receptor-like serine/threonine-protein kinase At3g47570 [Cornus florida]|uniref:probable LRR receptor-like serine/threonine-protein kinase At3g47570 n=1 Tax=Cornus florida TaxID=4283 RepID=UPI002898EC16|nr:probable LRR receptor-like serine/threonine-protein kinase At3g47570 [Cornus florida]